MARCKDYKNHRFPILPKIGVIRFRLNAVNSARRKRHLFQSLKSLTMIKLLQIPQILGYDWPLALIFFILFALSFVLLGEMIRRIIDDFKK